MNFIVGKVWPYVLNLPVIAAVVLAVSLLVYGTSSRSDVCDAFKDLRTDINSSAYTGDIAVNNGIDKLVPLAKNYSDDGAVQQDGKDLEHVHNGTYYVVEVVDATTHIASMCGVSLVH